MIDDKQHPEYYCQECGNKNIGWFAPNELWNFVMIGCEFGIICPDCFYKRAKDRGKSIWFTVIENKPEKEDEIEKVYMDGKDAFYSIIDLDEPDIQGHTGKVLDALRVLRDKAKNFSL